jgi:copper chaperone CopZ
MKKLYQVEGMTCGGCASTVKRKLSSIAGVNEVKIDLEEKEVEITSSEAINIDEIKQVLNDTNFTVSEV